MSDCWVVEAVTSAEEAEERVRFHSARLIDLEDGDLWVEGWQHLDGRETHLIRTVRPELLLSDDAWPFSSAVTDARDAVYAWSLPLEPRTWEDMPALVSKDGRGQRPYQAGEAFNPAVWNLVADAWDHEHCMFCGDPICAHPLCGFEEAYAAECPEYGTSWVCPPCYEEQVRGWSRVDPNRASSERGSAAEV